MSLESNSSDESSVSTNQVTAESKGTTGPVDGRTNMEMWISSPAMDQALA